MEERRVLRNLTNLNGERIDIVIEAGKILQICEAGKGQGQRIDHFSDVYVSSGWIDYHVHAFPELDPYGDEIDEIGVKQGVTTVVDAGSCGADRIAELIHSEQDVETRLFTFINISHIGLARMDELSDLRWIDREKLLNAINRFPQSIIGLKARISQSVVKENGIIPLHIACEFSQETALPLMVHIGSGPPNIEEIVALLKKDDIITHYLNGKSNNLFDEQGRPLKAFLDAIQRGVQLDVGHGTASFSFQVAKQAKKHNIPLGTISSDIYRKNRIDGPVYCLANVLSKFLYIGYSLEEVIGSVTTKAAARLGKPELGRIQAGDIANLTLFKIMDEEVVLIDSQNNQVMANQQIKPVGVFVNGKFIECEVRSETGH